MSEESNQSKTPARFNLKTMFIAVTGVALVSTIGVLFSQKAALQKENEALKRIVEPVVVWGTDKRKLTLSGDTIEAEIARSDQLIVLRYSSENEEVTFDRTLTKFLTEQQKRAQSRPLSPALPFHIPNQ